MMDHEQPSALEPQPEPTPFTAEPPKSNRSAMFIVFLVVFIDLLGFGIVLPLLPLYATEMLEPLLPGDSNRIARGVVLGLLMSSFSFMQFIFAPIWGRLSDRIGRRWILLLGLAASVVFYALFGVASEIADAGAVGTGLALLFAARIGAGIAGATISTAQAVIADCTTPEKRSHGMALIGAAFGIGFTFGPLLGFASLFMPLKGAPGFAAAAFSLIAFLLGLRLMPETLRPGDQPFRRRWLDWHGMRDTLRTPTVGLLVLTFFLATLAFGSLESTLALVNRVLLNVNVDLERTMTTEAARTTERQNFLVFAYVGFVLMLTQGFLYRRLVKRLGEVLFMRIGILFMGLGLAGGAAILFARASFDNQTTLLVCSLLVMTFAVMGFAFMTPSLQALISRRSDPARQGEVLGVNQSAAAMARILGPMIGIGLFHVTASHIWPYVSGAGLLLLVLFITLPIQQD
jgi:DHA1 family tetracycline resistance protein-like MFS transporter